MEIFHADSPTLEHLYHLPPQDIFNLSMTCKSISAALHGDAFLMEVLAWYKKNGNRGWPLAFIRSIPPGKGNLAGFLVYDIKAGVYAFEAALFLMKRGWKPTKPFRFDIPVYIFGTPYVPTKEVMTLIKQLVDIGCWTVNNNYLSYLCHLNEEGPAIYKYMDVVEILLKDYIYYWIFSSSRELRPGVVPNGEEGRPFFRAKHAEFRLYKRFRADIMSYGPRGLAEEAESFWLGLVI